MQIDLQVELDVNRFIDDELEGVAGGRGLQPFYLSN